MSIGLRSAEVSEARGLGAIGRRLALVAGVVAIGLAIYQVTSPGPPDGASYETVGDYVREIALLLFLFSSALTAALARGRGLAPSRAGWFVPVGYSLIAIGVGFGLAVRQELDWFFLVAGPGLLLSAAGFVLWAIWGARRSVFPLWAAVLLGFGGLTAIIMSEFGTSVLIGSFWLYLGTRRDDVDGLPRS